MNLKFWSLFFMDISKVNAKDTHINLHNKLYTICSQLKKEDKKHLTTLHMTWISDFKVHTRSNLSVKGIIPDVTCAMCGRAVEDATHVLLRSPGSSGNSSALAWLIVSPLTTVTLHRLRLSHCSCAGSSIPLCFFVGGFCRNGEMLCSTGITPSSTPSVVRRWLPNRRLDSHPLFYLCVYLSFVLCPLSLLSVYANA